MAVAVAVAASAPDALSAGRRSEVEGRRSKVGGRRSKVEGRGATKQRPTFGL